MTSLLQGSRQDSPLESIGCPSFALARLALGNDPWLDGHPMSAEFYEVCSLQLRQVTATYARNSIKCAAAVLGDHDVAEVFFFATEGLHSDLPSAKALLKRLRILVNQFARE